MSDRDLGMNRPISRRDFLDGVRISVAGSLLGVPGLGGLASATRLEVTGDRAATAYPPGLTGMRGSHAGSWEASHELKDGRSWEDEATDTGERYDLVVVGAGISGLAAAYFFRQAVGPEAKILVLDNHDDFGGHAKRNEFEVGGRALIGYGGSQSIDTPSGFSAESHRLLRDLGVDLDRFQQAFDTELFDSLGLKRAIFFDRETFGDDRLIVRDGMSWEEFAALTPLPDAARKDLVRLYTASVDYMPDLTPEQKLRRLSAMSYRDYLRQYAKVDPMVVTYLQTRSNGLFGIGIDGVAAIRGWRLEYPGFDGIGLERSMASRMGAPAKANQEDDPYIFHFPDGNASIPRLIVRALIPAVAAGNTMDDVVTARFDYARLDEPGATARVRLDSTVVRVLHRGAPESAADVELTYVRAGKAERVRSSHAVLACWNSVIPYLCPEMPEQQKQALSYAVKLPLTYTNVVIRNWRCFHKLGISGVSCPGSYFAGVGLDFPVSLGDYRYPSSPDEPTALHLTRSSTKPGLPPKEQFRAGRYELLTTPFSVFERNIRDQLGRILGAGGFDPATDIEAITVNRWPHGYAYEYAYLGEPDWTEKDMPCVIGRKPFGRVAVANSDAGGEAYVDCAIDQGHRAIRDLLA